MSRLLRVTLEFDDKIVSIEGEEVKKWELYNTSITTLAHTHGMNPFDRDPIKWMIQNK